ncbi:MAG: NADP-dependent oxidoreductase [Acidobacteriota bacterium]|nr:NADP-dependent oxidoreductase [Acidobacteriota bacterium]
MPHQNLQVRLAARPVGLPKESDFEIIERPIEEPGDGEVLVRNVYLSLDPAMRGWMDDRKSYIAPVKIGDVMRGLTVGVVEASGHPEFGPGDAVQGTLGWQEYARVEARELTRVPPGVPLRVALGPLGMTGLTAYFGLLDVGQLQEGDRVLVSAAAGAVGSMVGQIAKLHGCEVVGTAGTDEKCRWLEDELGFDAVINYKTAAQTHDSLHGALAEACPKGIDVYFDNVGGEMLDAALRLLRRNARVVICGAISQYNATEPVPGPANYLSLLVNRARMEGFLVFDYADRFAEGVKKLGGWLQEGKLRYREEVVEGLENAPRALLRLFDGKKSGKLMVQVAPEPAPQG